MKQTTKMSRAVSQLEHIYNSLNADFFGGELPVLMPLSWESKRKRYIKLGKSQKMCGEALKSKHAFQEGPHMRYTPKFLRGMLNSLIRSMGRHPEKYVRHPFRDLHPPPDTDL